jgi:uncharacterized surface protein with fasciclin (FAS1) repeats
LTYLGTTEIQKNPSKEGTVRVLGLLTLFLAAIAFAPGSQAPVFAAPSARAAEPAVVSADPAAFWPQHTIVDVAAEDGRFKTLLSALDAAGLTETLRGTGPFTVFAPTDDAFAKLPAGTLEALLADRAKLKSILLYHVVSGKLTAADVAKQHHLTTLQGATVTITLNGGKVMVNNATVIVPDVSASNGIIHAIDTVLLPPGG